MKPCAVSICSVLPLPQKGFPGPPGCCPRLQLSLKSNRSSTTPEITRYFHVLRPLFIRCPQLGKPGPTHTHTYMPTLGHTFTLCIPCQENLYSNFMAELPGSLPGLPNGVKIAPLGCQSPCASLYPSLVILVVTLDWHICHGQSGCELLWGRPGLFDLGAPLTQGYLE